ncbi:MAG: hypothetical protein ACK4QP_08160 [Pseudorhizobium sp.]
MTMKNLNLRSTAIAALLTLPLASGVASAQEPGKAQQSSPQTATGSGSTAGTGTSTGQQDSVVAKVGEKEIRGSDVLTVIGMLPPQLQSQPPQMLVPLALEQLILRELILEQAREDLAEDPEVVALVKESTQTATDDAIVQIWLDREMANVATDEAVQQVYDQAKSQQQDLPALLVVRPQIEQRLRQQAMQAIQTRLREGADIVLYDPAGNPVEQKSGSSPQSSGGQNSGNSAGNGTSGDKASGDASGSKDKEGQAD